MSEFEDKLNALLSNPDSMAQVMKLAQTLSAGQPSGGESTSAPPKPPPEKGPEPEKTADRPASNPLSALGLGDFDPAMLMKYLPLLQEFQSDNSNTMRLLMALQPFLKEEKRDKIERAARLAKLIHIGKKFFSQWEG